MKSHTRMASRTNKDLGDEANDHRKKICTYFKEVVIIRCVRDVCEGSQKGKERKKCNEYWSKEIRHLIKKKGEV